MGEGSGGWRRETHPVRVKISLGVVYDTIMCPELLQEDFIRVYRDGGNDGQVLKTHRVAGRLEMVDKVDELGIDIGAGASIRGLGVDNVWIYALGRARRAQRLDMLDFGRFFFLEDSASAEELACWASWGGGGWECHEV